MVRRWWGRCCQAVLLECSDGSVHPPVSVDALRELDDVTPEY